MDYKIQYYKESISPKLIKFYAIPTGCFSGMSLTASLYF